jgi:hypothetical protein
MKEEYLNYQIRYKNMTIRNFIYKLFACQSIWNYLSVITDSLDIPVFT